ncbi:uncharacterized protein Fot_34865 [Forsythia ovata]|uniref:Uncharacterized protein n=1 Tax=Forsythia ovata TaxID=205694 RepID=A0ABD1SJX1_9LAMI
MMYKSVEFIEVELDPSSSSQSDSHEASTEVINAEIKKLEKAIHRIVVRRSAPDWFPFLPRHSYWVPPSNSNGIMRHPQSLIEVVENLTTVAETNQGTPLDFLTEDETMSFSSARRWPSSTYFIEVQEVIQARCHFTQVEVDGKLLNMEDEAYVKKWAVDINQFACESLKLNHPETQFGGSLFEKLPKIWNCLVEFLKTCTIEGLNAEDEKLIDQAIESIRDPQILINNIQLFESGACNLNLRTINVGRYGFVDSCEVRYRSQLEDQVRAIYRKSE